ncbi:MAG TPA: GntR family transcriptional regulator [Phycisphaerae bacterium]|nr:GntR family transcriptional regulator [Phycisphaerae bacterium]HOM49867.1 GntR family transcriptional regulator [Phycisphaerae bacterium]HOQ84719.1 GntR family transcriptional regulator [Phycisphaerae bacterium]HPP26295.1 GntR family transcriptional regulator [Phycisphaerae bacterium]HPU25451.1 GntR family transcriptional regulator [Phycisphaerae bacterium]
MSHDPFSSPLWSSKRPNLRYAELARTLLNQITLSGMQPGERLGTEDELARKHRVSRVTVRAALSILEQDGYIDRKRALGTFIKQVPRRQPATDSEQGTVVFVCHSGEPTHPYENAGFMTMLHTIERVLRDEGLNLQIVVLENDSTLNRKRIEHLVHRPDVRGFCFVPIWSASLEEYEEYRSWLPKDIPCVLCNGYDLGAPNCVARAMSSGCHELMDLLINRGHRDIALLSGPMFSPQEYAIHAGSYIAAFQAKGLPVERAFLYKGYPGESLQTLVHAALTSRLRPTAVFASDARICATVLSVAAELGLSIPDDLSLVGYGDNVLHIHSRVPITAYAVQNDRLAESAARLLVDLIHGKKTDAESRVVPGKLIEGQSVRTL